MAKKRRGKQQAVSPPKRGVPGRSRGKDRGRESGASKASDRVARRRAYEKMQEEAARAMWERVQPFLNSPDSIGEPCRLELQALRAQQRDR